MPEQPAIRLSDADREAVARRLHRAVGEGRLTLDEFEQRVARVHAARTVAEVEPYVADLPVDSGVHVAPDDAILVADGGFPQKPALSRYWDLRVYLHIETAEVLRRGTIRDQAWMDSAEAAAARYRTYYRSWAPGRG